MSAHQQVHDALSAFHEEGEVIVGWQITMEVLDSEGRHLEYRAGGGADGEEKPTIWAVVGMLRAALMAAEGQLDHRVSDDDEDDES